MREDKKPQRSEDIITLWPHGLSILVHEEGGPNNDGIYTLREAGMPDRSVGLTGMEIESLCRWWSKYKKQVSIPKRLIS